MAKALMFVGSCNGLLPYVAAPKGAGISAFRVDLETGAAELLASEGDIANPTFVAVADDGRSLLATSEIAGEVEGLVSAYSIDVASGRLAPLGRMGTRGWTPAHLSYDASGRYAAVVNYGDVPASSPTGASVMVVRREADGGIAGVVAEATHRDSGHDPARQDRPHAHCVRWTPDNRFVLVADLGIDRVVVYRFDADSGAIRPHGELALPPGAGPRHFAFHPNGRFAYVINELSSSVASFAFDAAGATFQRLGEDSTLPPGVTGLNHGAAIQIAPGGRYLFAGNRGHDSVAHFDIDTDGVARFAGTTSSGGRIPRDFAFDPSGRVMAVANQASDAIVLFRYSPQSGALTPLGAPIAAGSPTAIAFHPNLS